MKVDLAQVWKDRNVSSFHLFIIICTTIPFVSVVSHNKNLKFGFLNFEYFIKFIKLKMIIYLFANLYCYELLKMIEGATLSYETSSETSMSKVMP